MNQANQNQAIKELVRSRYKDASGKPIELTPGQIDIFSVISGKMYPRTHCMTYTRYGKSFDCGLAVLTRASTYPEKWAIVAPTNKKAKIIMGVVIDHIFDNSYTSSKFDIGEGENRDRIRRERSKERINFKISDNRLGEIFILSTEGRRTKDVLDAVMGFGSPNVILDESGLIDDLPYIGIKRMLGDSFRYEDTFLFEIGNPFKRNHFLKTSQDPDYHHISIDWMQGVNEGRTDVRHIMEMKNDTDPITFGILYENKFPGEDQIDTEGYLPLITEAELDNAIVDTANHFGNSKLGVDVAGGGANWSVIIRRSEMFAEVVLRDKGEDTTILASEALKLKTKLITPIGLSPVSRIRPIVEIDIDSVGIGRGVYDIVRTKTDRVHAVIGGATAEDDVRFADKRAENYWMLKEWILSGGKLLKHESWKELLDIKWRHQHDKKIRIISKDELRRKGVPSPDVADSLANTFQNKDIILSQMQAEALYEEDPVSKDVI